MAWIGLYKPTEEEFSSVAGEFGLHGLAVEDATDAHQRPKLERYGETLFVVLKPARYLDEGGEGRVRRSTCLCGRRLRCDRGVTVRHLTWVGYASN